MKRLLFFQRYIKIAFVMWITTLLLFQSTPSEAVTQASQDGETQQFFPAVTEEQSGYLLFSINYVYRSGGQGDFESLQEGSVLHSGDHYKMIFTPMENCYIYIFQIDSAHKIYQLFPMKRFDEVVVNNFNPVQGGKTYYLPAQHKSFVLDEQTGKETIYFLASRQRDVKLEELYQQYQQQSDFLEKQLEQIDQLLTYAMEIKGQARMVAKAKGAAVTTWQEAGQTFSAIQQQLEDMCDGCVYVITFEHR